jgi:hypothetical protein
MNTRLTPILTASSVIALALLLQAAPVQASGASDGRDGGAIVVTFTKWLIDGGPLMEGVVGGDVAGAFAGEVLAGHTTADKRVTLLDAVYEAQAGRRSFTALLRGGEDDEKGTAILDGVVLAGWHTGARVHVRFRTLADCTVDGLEHGPCFQGTIAITPDREN